MVDSKSENVGISLFHDKFVPWSSSSSCSTWPSSSNQMNAWMLFGLSNSTMILYSRKYELSYFSLIYLLACCILETLYRRSWYLSIAEVVCFYTNMMILSWSLTWSKQRSLRWLMIFWHRSSCLSLAQILLCSPTFSWWIAWI